MKPFTQLITTLLFCCTMLATSPQRAEAEQASLRVGTQIPVRSLHSIHTSDGHADNAGFVIARDVRDAKGRLVVRAGTTVTAQVRITKERRIGRPGEIVIVFKGTESAWGKPIALSSREFRYTGKDKKGLAIGLGLAVSPLILLLKGKPATVPSGTELNAQVAY